MKYTNILLLLLPALLWAQEFQFRQEFDTIPVEIDGWQTFAPFGGGESESYPEFCDIDGDGDLDLFVGNYLGFITYYENEGTNHSPSFRLVTRAFEGIDLSGIPYSGKTAPRLCDLDGDGDYDFFTGDGVGLIHYWENTGISTLPEFEFVTDSLGNIDNTGKSHFDFADIDCDGDYDLFMGNYYGRIRFYINEGTPSVWNLILVTEQFAGIDVGYNAIPSFCDIDADHDYDLFIGNQAGKIWYYRNDGDSVNYNYTYVTDYYDSIYVNYYAAPEFADIDDDGDYDLFVGRESASGTINPGDVFYYENVGSSAIAEWSLATRNYLSLDPGQSLHQHHADIDADGDQDLFITVPGSSISLYENTGTADSGSFHWVTDTYQNISVNGGLIHFCDIDADQDSDLFIGQVLIPNPPYPSLHLFQNIGNPQNAIYSLYSNNVVPGNYHVSTLPALADIDADQDNDLFLSDNNDIRYYFANVGSPSSFSFASATTGWWGAFDDIFLADFCFYDIDDDGDLDLFGVPDSLDTHNWVWFYRNVGTAQNPSFMLETRNLLSFERQEDLDGIDVFDIDGDGDGDILILPFYDGGFYFFRNVTGEPAVPPLRRHPQAGLQLSLGPNPANPVTWVTFHLPAPQKATLAVYNLLGQKVATLAQGLQPPGTNTFLWNAAGFSSGVYVIRLEMERDMRVEKIVVLR